jgi:hypothetical protein
MPRHPRSTSDAFAVHCPTCGVLPEQRCVDVEGEPRDDAHAERRQLAFALVHEGDFAGSRNARLYRQLFPDVDAGRITCAPSRKQYRWRMRWSKVLLRWWATEDDAEKAYGAEYGCDCTSFGDDETPMPEAIIREPPPPIALRPGQRDDIIDAVARTREREQEHDRARRRKR